MNNYELAIQYFNEEKFDLAENIALDMFSANINIEASIDILSAIYLRTNNLNFLKNLSINDLNKLRKISAFLFELKTFEQAKFFYEQILLLTPNDEIALNNLGLTFENLDNYQNAKNCYQKSLEIKENYNALYNLGVLYRKLKEFKKSENYLKKAIIIQPDNPYANYALGMTYLIQKNFQKGYKYFSKRPIREKTLLKNFWNGKKHPDKTILVFCEYGFGDAIMFSRYFPKLKEYFKTIKVCCKKNLIKLFEQSFPDIEFINNINEIAYDYAVFSMDLPYYLNLDFDNIPLSEKYLKTDIDKVNFFKEKFFNNNSFKVGIFFIGGELTKRNARYRAIELSQLEKLFSLNDTKFYSFQKDDIFEELKNYPEIIDLSNEFNDFSDTAAAIQNLDLMITIDSVTAHLAGALGIKTLLMLPYFSEWRWFEENTTPWYKNMKIYRQQSACNWQSVVNDIYNELKTILE